MSKGNKYTKEQLIEKLKIKAKETNQTPKHREMKFPGGAVYNKYFGTWENALHEAGLVISRKEGIYNEESLETIICKMKELYIIKNDRLLQKEVQESTEKNPKTIFKWIGVNSIDQLNEFLEQKYPELVYFREDRIKQIRLEYISHLNNLYKEHSHNDFYNGKIYHKFQNYSKIKKFFGTWNKALIAAGIPIIQNRYKLFSLEEKDMVLERIIKYANQIDRSMLIKDIKYIDNISNEGSIKALFRMTWLQLKRKLDLNLDGYEKFKEKSEQDVFDLLKAENKHIDIMSISIYSFQHSNKCYPAIFYYKRFNIGSWKEFVTKILNQ